MTNNTFIKDNFYNKLLTKNEFLSLCYLCYWTVTHTGAKPRMRVAEDFSPGLVRTRSYIVQPR